MTKVYYCYRLKLQVYPDIKELQVYLEFKELQVCTDIKELQYIRILRLENEKNLYVKFSMFWLQFLSCV